jgi:hypothetical protein
MSDVKGKIRAFYRGWSDSFRCYSDKGMTIGISYELTSEAGWESYNGNGGSSYSSNTEHYSCLDDNGKHRTFTRFGCFLLPRDKKAPSRCRHKDIQRVKGKGFSLCRDCLSLVRERRECLKVTRRKIK